MQKYFIFSDATDMVNLTRISFEDTKNFVEETSMREVFNLKDDFDFANDDRDFGEEWSDKGYGFIDNPYFFQNNEEIFEGNGDDDFEKHLEIGDGDIIVNSKHPNLDKIIDNIPHHAKYFYGSFKEITKEDFLKKIEPNKNGRGFNLMIIELDID